MQEEESLIWGHPQCTSDDVLHVTELCAGMGGMTQGAKASTFVPAVACELPPKMAELYQIHSDAKMVVGDITKLDVLHQIYQLHPRTTTLACGQLSALFGLRRRKIRRRPYSSDIASGIVCGAFPSIHGNHFGVCGASRLTWIRSLAH